MIPVPRRERILITVKTYPTLSKKYGETVCTAGIREDGTWLRLYPVPFRRLGEAEQYRKYDWVNCSLVRHSADSRPESFRPFDTNELEPVGHIGTDDDWRERRTLLLNKARVYTRLGEIIDGAKSNVMSLAVFKPTRVKDFIWEEEDRNWDANRLRQMRERSNQLQIFAEDAWRQTFEVIPKLPYSFSYRFQDADGISSELQILDWEAGALYWNCLRSTDGDEKTALQKVRRKYFDDFLRSDLHFFLGTTQEFHFRAPNPWVIVGVLPIPHEKQLGLL